MAWLIVALAFAVSLLAIALGLNFRMQATINRLHKQLTDNDRGYEQMMKHVNYYRNQYQNLDRRYQALVTVYDQLKQR